MVEINYNTIGRTIQGSVFDTNRKLFDRALRRLDEQLYTKWNPNKEGGRGCWEIRRRPDFKVPVYKGSVGGRAIYVMEYKEYDLIHHVLDTPSLYFGLIDYLKSIDTFDKGNFASNLEYKEDCAKEKIRAQERAELRYALKHHRKAMIDFKESARSGGFMDIILKALGN